LRHPDKENLVPAPKAFRPTRKPKDYKNAYSNVKRKVTRMSLKETTLQGTIADLKNQLKVQQKERDIAVRKLEIAAKKATELVIERERRLLVAHQKLMGAQVIVGDVLQKNRALAKRVHRASGVLQRAIARTKARPLTSRLTRQAIYTVHAHQMAREMVAAGCARGKVGPLMSKIAAIFGVKINEGRSMSRRTVGRAILEGGIAARMQLTHELSINEGTTYRYCDIRD
jgi:hypothetical protein